MSIDVFWSATAHDPRLHLSPACSGLHRVTVHPRPALSRAAVPSLAALARAGTGTPTATRAGLERRIRTGAALLPCRSCALEQVLDTALGTRPRTGLHVCFSALPSHRADGTRAARVDLTDSAVARLERIAGRARLMVTNSRLGPVAFGVIRPSALGVLAANLHTLAPSPRPLTARTASVVWSLLPPGGQEWDPWEIAAAV